MRMEILKRTLKRVCPNCNKGENEMNVNRQELIKQLQSEYEEEHKLKVGVQKILQMDTTAPAVKELLQEEAEKTTPSEEL